MKATEFISQCDYPVVFFAGNGQPAGMTLALHDETELPFDLSEISGICEQATFEATNLAVGASSHGWKFRDWAGNTIYKIQVFDDEQTWKRLHAEYLAID